MVDFHFRIMQEQDLDQVLNTETGSHVSPWKANHFLDCIKSQYWNYVFVNSNQPDSLLGHCIVMPGVDEAHLLNITIHPKYRRLGIASRAIDALGVSCIEKNFHRLLLEVRKSNEAAVQLYHHLGFEQIGVRRDYYPLPELENCPKREDAIVMQKYLTNENN